MAKTPAVGTKAIAVETAPIKAQPAAAKTIPVKSAAKPAVTKTTPAKPAAKPAVAKVAPAKPATVKK